MASENIKDWDLSLPSSENISENIDDISQEQRQNNENLNKLANYVELMAYRQIKPIKSTPYTESLAKPRRRTLQDNAKQFTDVMSPKERGDRLKRLAAKYNTITAEQLENIIRSVKSNERRKVFISKRKEGIYYDLLTKLELQCQTQYLNVVLKKFANFISKLSTTMCLPQKLIGPYARMQRGLFCNILECIGAENSAQPHTYYNIDEGSEYGVCHKLSHAILSLIIKSLDLASTRNPHVEASNLDAECATDNYIKNRLLRTAEKKIFGSKRDKNNKLFRDDSLDKNFEKFVRKV